MAALDLTGKCAIVTGASSGIGRATAVALADAGVRVAGGARRVGRLETEIALALDVADCVLFALTRPWHVNVDEIVVKARNQASGARVLRDG